MAYGILIILIFLISINRQCLNLSKWQKIIKKFQDLYYFTALIAKTTTNTTTSATDADATTLITTKCT